MMLEEYGFVSGITGLPELTILLLGRNLDHSWFVDNPGSSVALLYDPDDPGLVALNLLDRKSVV